MTYVKYFERREHFPPIGEPYAAPSISAGITSQAFVYEIYGMRYGTFGPRKFEALDSRGRCTPVGRLGKGLKGMLKSPVSSRTARLKAIICCGYYRPEIGINQINFIKIDLSKEVGKNNLQTTQKGDKYSVIIAAKLRR